MAPILGGHARPTNVPAVLDWLRKFQDAYVVFQGVAVPSRVLYDPDANKNHPYVLVPGIEVHRTPFRARNHLRMETSTAWAPSDEVLMS